MLSDKNPLVSIVGPTAVGKTEFAINLALKYGGEIISGDSMQIYKEFNILSAKPSCEQLKKVPHHLVNILSVKEEFSAAKFKEFAENSVNDIVSRGKRAFLVGGTGLYIDAFTKNINFESRECSAGSRIDLSDLNNNELMLMLRKIDPVSAEKIHINDTKRLRRAAEFFYSFGYSISLQNMRSKLVKSKYKICKIGLNYKNRDLLYDKINNRVDVMFKSNIEAEVSEVLKIGPSKTAAFAIGYKEILPYILGKCTKEEAINNLKQATRRYAKRQLTWFKKDKEINWICVDDFNNFDEIVLCGEKIINDSGIFYE